MKQTDKYNYMISAFQCDFSLARDDSKQLFELNRLIANKNPSLLHDIDLLEELEWKLRNGRIIIMDMEVGE